MSNGQGEANQHDDAGHPTRIEMIAQDGEGHNIIIDDVKWTFNHSDTSADGGVYGQ